VLFYAKYANFYVTQQKSPDETTLSLFFSRHIHVHVILCALPVRGVSRVQHRATWWLRYFLAGHELVDHTRGDMIMPRGRRDHARRREDHTKGSDGHARGDKQRPSGVLVHTTITSVIFLFYWTCLPYIALLRYSATLREVRPSLDDADASEGILYICFFFEQRKNATPGGHSHLKEMKLSPPTPCKQYPLMVSAKSQN